MQPKCRQNINDRDHEIFRTERAATENDPGAVGTAHIEPTTAYIEPTVNEGDKYRAAARRMREQADVQPDHVISEQFRKIADRYDELAEQVEAAARRAD